MQLAARFIAPCVVHRTTPFRRYGYVVLNVATSKSHSDNSFYGLAIGFTVVAGAAAVGSISGGAFNPAVALGAAVMGMFAWPTLWVYVLAQAIGGTTAAVTFVALNPNDK